MWLLRYQAKRTDFFVILDHLYPFTTQSKMSRFSKIKKKTGNIVVLHMCTINDNHMIHVFWDMDRDGQIFFYFGQFSPLFSSKNLKNQSFEERKLLEILSFYKSVTKTMITCNSVLEIWHVTYVIVIFHFSEVGAAPKICYRKKIFNLWNLPINWKTKPVLESH